MDLTNYLQENLQVSLLTSTQDNHDVLELMAKSPMNVGGIELLYDRAPQFSDLLKCQNSYSRTFLGRHRDGKLFGFFSVSTGKKWYQGKKVDCGYIGDFRTDNSRASAVFWRKSYAQILAHVQSSAEAGLPKYFLTAILKKNHEAIRNLTQVRKDFGFSYNFLREVDMVNAYGFLPWSKKSSLDAVPATLADLPALKLFLDSSEKEKDFGSIFDGGDGDCWQYRQQFWHGYSIEKFLLIKNSEGQILACTLPWDPGFAKRMTVLKAPKALVVFFKLIKIFGFNMPAVGDSLRTIYLTHLNVSSELSQAEVATAFLQSVFQTYKDAHMVSFADHDGFSKKMKSMISQRISVMLYSVSLSKDTINQASSEKIGFEMGLV